MMNLLVLVVATAASATTPSVDSILSPYKAAVGDLPTQGTARFIYAYETAGLKGTATVDVDLHTGAFVQAAQADIVTEGRGYDTKLPWQRDTSGANTPQEGGDRIPVAVNDAFRYANSWWRPGYSGASITLAGADHLVVTPKGGKPFHAHFDPNTHLLTQIEEDHQFFHTRTTYADYRAEHGVTLPHTITIDNGAGPASVEHLQLQNFALTAAHPLSFYSCPPTPLLQAAPVTLPFKLLNNHIYIDAKVNGKGPYTYIVDTGGHNLISPRLAQEVGIRSIGAAAMSGAGEKTAQSGFAQVEEIALDQLELRDQLAFVAPIYDTTVEGIQVDGMVGFELFRRFMVRIDYGKHTMTVGPHITPEGTAIPFVFYDHLPMVSGKVGELPARFDIDSGSRSEIDLTGPFVQANNLRARFTKGVEAVTGWGVGGPSRSYVVRLPSLTLGGATPVKDVVAGLSKDKGGSISDPNYDGNIGSGFLKRYVVTFDYAQQKMYLQPLQSAPADAGTFDRAGMWLNSSAQGYVVTEVSAGGPAARAGVKVDDVITAVNSEPARPDKLADTRKLLRSQPPGTKVELVLKQAKPTAAAANSATPAQGRRVVLTLADQI
jgi:hypothetical protein